MREYTPACKTKIKEGHEDEFAMALVREPCRIVAEHFAIREIMVDHPVGEGMTMRGHQLDHMPTGMRAHGDEHFFGAIPEHECEAMAMSLASLGDWSVSDVDAIPTVDPPWLKKARKAAETGHYVDQSGEEAGQVEMGF
jgi:hypothetical protein